MKTKIVLLYTFLLPTAMASAQSYQIDWYVIGSGGGHSESANYQLDGTIGQPVVGAASSASYTIEAGFWVGRGISGPQDFAYLAGDFNMAYETVDPDNNLTGPWRLPGDVSFLVNYFNVSSGLQPCLMHNPNTPDQPGGPQNGYFFASADVTGDCIVAPGDISRLVQYFAFNPAAVIRWCGWDKPDPTAYYPPQWLTNRGSPGEQPVPPLDELPIGWPNCQVLPPAVARVIPSNSARK